MADTPRLPKEEFNKELTSRIKNAWMHHVYKTRSGASRQELNELDKFPMEVLAKTFEAGANVGIAEMLTMIKEGK